MDRTSSPKTTFLHKEPHTLSKGGRSCHIWGAIVLTATRRSVYRPTARKLLTSQMAASISRHYRNLAVIPLPPKTLPAVPISTEIGHNKEAVALTRKTPPTSEDNTRWAASQLYLRP